MDLNAFIYLLNVIMLGGQKAKIAKVILLYKLHVSIFAISLILSIPVSSVKGLISAYIRTRKIPDPKKRGKRKKLSQEQIEKILKIARTHPYEFGLPLARWTLRRLSDFLCGFGIEVSHETVRKILQENGIRFTKSKAWKVSPDPLYNEKKRMLDELKNNIPEDTAFVYVDESKKAVKEYPGEAWSEKRPYHITDQKTKGVVSLFISKDKEGKIKGIVREGHCNSEKFLEFVCLLAFKYKEEGYKRLLIVMDNASYHKKAEKEMKKIGEVVGIEIMWFYLPKGSPWLNPCEVEWKLFKSLYLSLRKIRDKEEFGELFFGFLKDRNEKRIKIS